MAIHGFFKKPKTMKARILLLFFLFSSVFAFAQRRPDQFTEETSPTNANFEVYSQKNGQVRRASLLNLKKYFTPEVETAAINYVPAATGNTTNLMEFVKTAGDSIYFIDFGLALEDGLGWDPLLLTLIAQAQSETTTLHTFGGKNQVLLQICTKLFAIEISQLK